MLAAEALAPARSRSNLGSADTGARCFVNRVGIASRRARLETTTAKPEADQSSGRYRSSKGGSDPSELVRRGFTVLLPFGVNQRYDLVLDVGGEFIRGQCKTGRLRQGSVVFSTAQRSVEHSRLALARLPRRSRPVSGALPRNRPRICRPGGRIAQRTHDASSGSDG